MRQRRYALSLTPQPTRPERKPETSCASRGRGIPFSSERFFQRDINRRARIPGSATTHRAGFVGGSALLFEDRERTRDKLMGPARLAHGTVLNKTGLVRRVHEHAPTNIGRAR